MRTCSALTKAEDILRCEHVFMSAVCVVMFIYICSKTKYFISTVSILTACINLCPRDSLLSVKKTYMIYLDRLVSIKQMYEHLYKCNEYQRMLIYFFSPRKKM